MSYESSQAASRTEKYKHLVTREQCLWEIGKRRNLIAQMVGNLYPGILSREIEDIYERMREIASCTP